MYFNYAFGLMFSGRFDEAEAELRLARELDPLDIGQRAETILTAMLDDEPRHLLARSLRGSLHLIRNRPEEALAEYRIAQAHALAGATPGSGRRTCRR